MEEEEEESHLNPKTPSKPHDKSEEINPQLTIKPLNKRNETSGKCFVYTLLIIVILSIFLLIFGLIVLQITTPSLKPSSVTVKNLHYTSAPQQPSLNMTIIAAIRIHNKNFGRFKYRAGNTTLIYGNATIGVANIYSGGIDSREDKHINVTMEVIDSDYNYVRNYMNFSRDVDSGLVNLKCFAELRGEIRVVKIFNRHRTAVMNCSMDLNLTTQSVQELLC